MIKKSWYIELWINKHWERSIPLSYTDARTRGLAYAAGGRWARIVDPEGNTRHLKPSGTRHKQTANPDQLSLFEET